MVRHPNLPSEQLFGMNYSSKQQVLHYEKQISLMSLERVLDEPRYGDLVRWSLALGSAARGLFEQCTLGIPAGNLATSHTALLFVVRGTRPRYLQTGGSRTLNSESRTKLGFGDS